jgi:hypothetical protein
MNELVFVNGFNVKEGKNKSKPYLPPHRFADSVGAFPESLSRDSESVYI